MNPAIRALKEAPPPHPAIGVRLKRRIEQQSQTPRSSVAGLMGALALGLMLAALFSPTSATPIDPGVSADGGFANAQRLSATRRLALDGGLFAEAGPLED